jgi:murein DD-endopeptidase MepM/ murein hydrolase activator NlpD
MEHLIALALRLAVADGFDYPVGPPDAAGYHDAQPFGGASAHLGSDWNGDRGGDSDLGDPVHAVAAGRVSEAFDHGGGWGNVVRVVHRVRERGGEHLVESLYAHLDTIEVEVGQAVMRGQQVGTIGTAHGTYRAHLHLELRAGVGAPLGGGYGVPVDQLDPTAFIERHRPRPGRRARLRARH